MRVLVETDYPSGTFRSNDSFVAHTDAVLLQDGDKLDIRANLEYSGGPQPRTERARLVLLDDRLFHYQLPNASPVRRGATSRNVSNHRANWIGDPRFGLVLEGYIYGMSGQNVVDAAAIGAVQLNEDRIVGDTECAVLRGDTNLGRIEVCIERTSGALVSFVIEKGPHHIFDDSPGGQAHLDAATSPFEDASIAGWTATLRDVTLSSEAGVRVATHGTVQIDYTSTTGAIVSCVNNVTRSSIALGSDALEGEGAFKIDFEEAAVISDWDHPDSGVQLVWHNGEVALADALLDSSVSVEPRLHGRSLLLLIAANVALVVILIVIFRRMTRAGVGRK